MSLPTASEINPIPNDLNGRAAEEHFLGKTVEDAVRLFEENSIYYLEDLQWMGPTAFSYYLPAAVAYVKSAAGKSDSDAVCGLASIISSRLQDDVPMAAQIRPLIRELGEYVMQHRKEFDPSLSFYQHVVQFYKDILRDLGGEPGASPNGGPGMRPGNSEVGGGTPSVS